MKNTYTIAFAKKRAKELLKEKQVFIPGTEDHTFVLWLLRKRFPLLTDQPHSEYSLSIIKKIQAEIPFGYYYPDGDFPDDIGLKVDSAEGQWKKSNCFYFKDPKNEFDTWEMFSCKKTFMSARQRKIFDTSDAFRRAIQYQVIMFLHEEIKKPENKVLKQMKEHDPLSVHVDHNVIPFCDLLARFLEQEKQSIESVEIIPSGPNGYDFIDAGFKERWMVFHQKHATLQLLPADKNIEKGALRRTLIPAS